MAPFQYTPYENRLAGSIGDILARRGEIAAAAAQRAGIILSNGTRQQGDIAARAQEQSGQAMAGAVQGAVGAAARVPEMARQATAQDQETTLRQGAIDDRARQVGELKALDDAYQKSGGNREAIINALPGHMRGKVAADFENFDKIHAESVELQTKADEAKGRAFAAAGMSIRAHGYDPVAAQLTISDLKTKYAKDPAAMNQIAQFEAKLHSDPTPGSIQAMIDPILQADPKTREDLQKEAADAETKRNHDLLKAGREATATATAARDKAAAENAAALRKQGDQRLVIEGKNAATAAARETREANAAKAQTTLDEDGLDLAATAYRLTRQLPSRNATQNGAILSRAAKQAKELGDSPAATMTRQAAFKADAGSLDKVQKMSDAAASFENKALGQIEIIRGLSPKVGRTDSPMLNSWLLAGKDHVVGDSDTHQLFNAVSTFSAEYAKIMEGSTGSAAGSSDAARRAAERLVSATQGKGSLEDTLKLMQREMNLTINGYETTIDHIRTRLGGNAPAAAVPAAAAPVGGGKGGGPGAGGPPAAPALQSGFVRVKGPNGESGQMPKGSALLPGWTIVQ